MDRTLYGNKNDSIIFFRLLDEAESGRNRTHDRLKENVTSALLLTLNDLLHEFRASQSIYIRRMDSRRENVDSFLIVPSTSRSTNSAAAAFDFNEPTAQQNSNEELTIDQIQAILENEHLVKEREKEV